MTAKLLTLKALAQIDDRPCPASDFMLGTYSQLRDMIAQGCINRIKVCTSDQYVYQLTALGKAVLEGKHTLFDGRRLRKQQSQARKCSLVGIWF